MKMNSQLVILVILPALFGAVLWGAFQLDSGVVAAGVLIALGWGVRASFLAERELMRHVLVYARAYEKCQDARAARAQYEAAIDRGEHLAIRVPFLVFVTCSRAVRCVVCGVMLGICFAPSALVSAQYAWVLALSGSAAIVALLQTGRECVPPASEQTA